MDVSAGSERRLSAEELMLFNCGIGETLESPLDHKEIQPVRPEYSFGRTNAEAETPILWTPDGKN